MFKFYGRTGRGAFLRGAALRVGLFAFSVVGFPFLLITIVKGSGCAGIGGACGALGVVVSTAVKPIAYILLVFSFAGISMRRARDAGLPPWVGLAIPVFLSLDYNFFVYAGTPWGFAFSAGILHQIFPRFAVLALYGICMLGVLPSRRRDGAAANPFGFAGLVAVGFAAVLLLPPALGLAFAITGPQPWMSQLAPVFRAMASLMPYATIGLVVVLGWVAWRYRALPAASSAPLLDDDRADTPRPPIISLLAAALVLSVAAFSLALSKDMSSLLLLALVTNASSMLLPTLVVYFLPMLALWFVFARPGARSRVALVLALAPFLFWGYAHYTAYSNHQREVAEIAAIPTAAALHVPATLVLETDQMSGTRAAWAFPEIQRTIAKGSHSSSLMQFERPVLNGMGPRQSTPTALPDEYMLLRVGRSSGFAKKGMVYSAAGGPFELRYVDASHDDLVAVWYREFSPRPSMLPVLMTSGWYRGSNSTTTTEIDARVGEFLEAAFKKRI